MRKPVRSVVANRKYFQGGGLTKNTNPMAVSQPSGIMASSQPLVDMVANSANNPQGGMSPLNYADGGLAKFEPGGMFADRPRVQGLMNTLGNITKLMQPSRLLAKISEKVPATGIGVSQGGTFAADSRAEAHHQPVKVVKIARERDVRGRRRVSPHRMSVTGSSSPVFLRTAALSPSLRLRDDHQLHLEMRANRGAGGF